MQKNETRVPALLLSVSTLLFTNEIRQATGLLEIEIISEYQLYIDKSIVVHHILPTSQEIFSRREKRKVVPPLSLALIEENLVLLLVVETCNQLLWDVLLIYIAENIF